MIASSAYTLSCKHTESNDTHELASSLCAELLRDISRPFHIDTCIQLIYKTQQQQKRQQYIQQAKTERAKREMNEKKKRRQQNKTKVHTENNTNDAGSDRLIEK